jgi:DNA-binding response OmpR family regulator
MGKVLFVDSNSALLVLYAEEFRDEGYEVFIARTGAEALSLYRENTPKVVVVDPHLPDMNEIDFLKSLFALDNRASVIIYDAYPNSQDIWTPRVGSPILKSSDFTQLKEKIAEILSNWGKDDN